MTDDDELRATPRTMVAFVVIAVVASLVALFLGEYEIEGPLPIAAGFLLSALLGEVIITGSRQQHPVLGVYVGAASALAIVLAGAIDANNVEPIKAGVWPGAAVAMVVGYIRGAGVSVFRRKTNAPTDGPITPDEQAISDGPPPPA